jgi:hypothetical protein
LLSAVVVLNIPVVVCARACTCHRSGSLDVTELFKLDALEIVDRADKRRHLYDSVAGG